MGRKLSDTARPLTRLATLDSEPDRLLKLWQEAGRIPTHYTSWDQIDKEYLTRIEAAERLLSPTELKKSKAKIANKVREEMGITYKNVLGNHTLLVGPSSTGDIRGLNKRAIREDINIEAENWIRKKKGDGVFESYKKRLLKEWNTVNKQDIANVRKWFHSATGKGKLHRGHGFAALVGGGLLADNVAAEIGWRNVGHGPAPRFSVEIMEALNMPKNDLEGFYFYDLKKKGLTISNKPNTPLMLAADTGAISPNQLELIQLKLDDLRAQGVSSQTIDRFSQDVSELGRETTGGNVGKGQIKSETWKNRPTIRREHRPKQYTAATAFGNVQEGLAKRRAIATGLTLSGLAGFSALGAGASIAGGAERLKIAQQTGSGTDYLAAGLEGVSAVGDVLGPGGELISTPADLLLLAMDAPETYKALMHRSDSEIEYTEQKQKEQDSVNSYTAQVGMDPQQRLIERSNIRMQQYKDKLEAHRAGRRQERQWQLEGQDYVTQTPNIAERVNQTLTKIVTNPLNEIKYGYQQLLNFTKHFR